MQTKEYDPTKDPQNIGYYVKDMPNMPSWEERERLRKKAAGEASDSIAARSLKLWDYFFRIKPEEVGEPQQEEISRLQKSLKELKKLKEQLEQERKAIERRVRKKLKNESESRVLGGIMITLIGFLIIFAYKSENDNIFMYWIGMLSLAIGVLLIVTNLFDSPEHEIQAEIKKLFDPIRRRLEDRAREIIIKASTNKPGTILYRLSIEEYIELAQKRISDLRFERDALILQIPKGLPSDKEVNVWFAEVVKSLKEKAIDETGLRDQIADEKAFPIHGDAAWQTEHQELGKIIRQYTANEDNEYHLAAWQKASINGKPTEFYGVYYIEFILVGKDLLAVYSTFYDFIMHHRFSARTQVLHYVDIVSIQTAQEYIVFESSNNQKLGLDRVPSLTLSLTSSERIRISYPPGKYIIEERDEEDEDSDNKQNKPRLKFEMEPDIKNANRHIRERMKVAKQELRGLGARI